MGTLSHSGGMTTSRLESGEVDCRMAPAARQWFRIMLICLDKVRLVWCGAGPNGNLYW